MEKRTPPHRTILKKICLFYYLIVLCTYQRRARGSRLYEGTVEREKQEEASATLCRSTLRMGKILAVRETGTGSAERVLIRSKDDSFAVTTQLDAVPALQVYRNDKLVSETPKPKAALAIEDRASEWRHHFTAAFDQITFNIPYSRIKTFAITAGRPQFSSLECEQTVVDEIVRGIGQSIAPLFESSAEVSPLFLEQLDLALLAHLAQNYGGVHFPTKKKGTLATWQQQRATEFLTSQFNSQFSINTLADVCELSRSYFMKSFKDTFGRTPHRWLMEYRVMLAKEKLKSGMPIADIAVFCGFSDQSHLTRVFSEIAGVSPGSWRRQNRILIRGGN